MAYTDATYPAAIKIFTNKKNDVDAYDALHVNDLQNEVMALQHYIGVTPQGSKADLDERISVIIGTDGAFAHSNAFPASPVDGQGFYRTDEDTYYIYNGASWDALGQSLSNVAFEWYGTMGAYSGTDIGFVEGGTLTPTAWGGARYSFLAAGGAAYRTVWETRFKKLQGFSTVTVNAWIWQQQSGTTNSALLRVSIGSVAGSAQGSDQQQTPEMVSFTIDVSGLASGTFYNVIAEIMNDNIGQNLAYLGGLIGIIS